MKKYRVKRPDGSFTKNFNSSAEAVLEACEYVNIHWKEGCEAVANLDAGMTTLVVFKDKDTGKMCGVDKVNVPTEASHELSISFKNKANRRAALEMIKTNFDIHGYSSKGN